MTEIVETTLGRHSGQVTNGVRVFRGIPYAAPPLPPHRFAAPRPMTPWIGVRPADMFGPQARQILFPFLDPALAHDPRHDATRDYHRGIAFEPIPYDEDCLYLDVWTPSASGKRPVMVWLHGGGFAAGAGSWGWSRGDVLAPEQDVVLVTLNHRLNIFGFLCLDGHANAGMLDIIAALGWVRDNIAAFGGDPGNVTIFGQSGGGMKVSTLMAMPAAHGLFHKAIVQSGPFLRAVPRDRANDVTARMLKWLGGANALQDATAEALLDAFASVQEGATGVPRQFGPVVDGVILPAHPFDPMASAQSAGIPMLIGATTEEVTSLIGFADPSIYTIGNDALIPRLAAYCGASSEQAARAVTIYRTARPTESAARLFAQIASDWRFGYASTIQAERQATQAPVYAYELAWQSPVQGGKMGAAHNLCMPLVFGRDKAPGITGEGTAHHALAAAMQTAWASFARTGDPNHPGLPVWPRYDATARHTMRLDAECRVERDPHAAERIAQSALPPRA
jgi:para-nitrobenzyl esterase